MLRPMDIVLLEAVPHGEAPTLNRRFAVESLPGGFAEPSRELPLRKMEQRFAYQTEVPATKTGGVLVVSVEQKQGLHPITSIHRKDNRDLRGASMESPRQCRLWSATAGTRRRGNRGVWR